MNPFVSLKKLSLWRIPTSVFCLFFLTFSPAFTLARDKQLVRDNRIASSLIDQIANLDVQNITFDENTDSVTLIAGGLSYVFENISTISPTGSISIDVSIYNAIGNHIQTVALANISVVDPNRVDFNAIVMDADGATSDIVKGSLTGMRDREHSAVASINNNGMSELMVVNFSGFNTTSANKFAASNAPVTMTPMAKTVKSGINKGFEEHEYMQPSIALIDDIVVVITIVGFVLITCAFFGWWGC